MILDKVLPTIPRIGLSSFSLPPLPSANPTLAPAFSAPFLTPYTQAHGLAFTWNSVGRVCSTGSLFQSICGLKDLPEGEGFSWWLRW